MIFEETEYFDLKQVEANICVYLGFAIIYVVQRLFMFQIKEDSQADTTTPFTDCSSALYRQSLPHVYQLFSRDTFRSWYHIFLQNNRLDQTFRLFQKKEKEKRGRCFPGLIVYFVLFFSRKQKTFSRQARAPVTGGEGGVGTPYIHTYIHTYTSSRIYENHTSWLLEATHLKPTQLKSIIPRNSALTHGFLTASPLSLFSPQ